MKHLITFVFTIVCSLSFAASSSSATLSWDDVLKEAAANNDELLSAHKNLSYYQQLLDASYGNLFPTLSGSLAYTYGNTTNLTSTTLFSGVSYSSSTPQSNYSATLNSGLNLFNGFQDVSTINQAQANKDNAVANLELVKSKLSFNLKSAFATLLYAQDSIQLNENILKRQEDNLRMVELRYEGGNENKGSFLLARAQTHDAKYQYIQALDALITAQATMARVLGRENSSEIVITGNVPSHSVPSKIDYEEKAIQTPEYKQALANLNVAKAVYGIDRSNLLPTLKATGSYGRQGVTSSLDTEVWSVGLTLTVPLFSGLKDFHTTKGASENRSAIEYTKTNTLLQKVQDLKTNYFGFAESVEKYKSDEDYLEAASVRERIATNQYNNGLIVFNDWTIIVNDLITRQHNAIQSKRNMIVAEATWEQTEGTGDIP